MSEFVDEAVAWAEYSVWLVAHAASLDVVGRISLGVATAHKIRVAHALILVVWPAAHIRRRSISYLSGGRGGAGSSVASL
jgi:hypothetical protein